MSNTPIPIKDVLADPTHPAHDIANDFLAKLESGEVNLCACMGPMYGEPFCACEMKRKGLPLNTAAREEDLKQFQEAMQRWFDKNENDAIDTAKKVS